MSRFQFLLLILAVSMPLGCRRQIETPPWIVGNWKYDSAATIDNEGKARSEEARQGLIQVDADFADNCLSISDDGNNFQFLAIQVGLALEEVLHDMVVFRGTGTNEIGTIRVTKFSDNQIELTMTVPNAAGSTDDVYLGIFTKETGQ